MILRPLYIAGDKLRTRLRAMPRLRTFGKKPPDGFDEIEDELEDFERRMRDAVRFGSGLALGSTQAGE